MDHKGNIAITILVLGVFAVCSLALLSFYSSTLNIDNSFVRIDIVKQAKVFEKEIIFEESQGKNIQEMELFKKGIEIGDVIFNASKDENYYIIEGKYSENKWWGVGSKKEIFSIKYWVKD